MRAAFAGVMCEPDCTCGAKKTPHRVGGRGYEKAARRCSQGLNCFLCAGIVPEADLALCPVSHSIWEINPNNQLNGRFFPPGRPGPPLVCHRQRRLTPFIYSGYLSIPGSAILLLESVFTMQNSKLDIFKECIYLSIMGNYSQKYE
jgi:hypothetical protein